MYEDIAHWGLGCRDATSQAQWADARPLPRLRRDQINGLSTLAAPRIAPSAVADSLEPPLIGCRLAQVVGPPRQAASYPCRCLSLSLSSNAIRPIQQHHNHHHIARLHWPDGVPISRRLGLFCCHLVSLTEQVTSYVVQTQVRIPCNGPCRSCACTFKTSPPLPYLRPSIQPYHPIPPCHTTPHHPLATPNHRTNY